VIRIWPGRAPGTQDWAGPEETADAELPNLGKVHIVTNVTVPTVTVVRPPAGKSNGTAMVVVPGGAFRALPWDLDGLETARWLTERGITAFILKYRVRPPGADAAADRSFDDFTRRTEAARAVAVSDAEQAMRLVRSRAKQFGIAPDRVGMIGFSAGAMATVIAADSRDASVRPNFAVSLYGAMLKTSGPSAGAAPLFIVAAQDDREAPPVRSADMFARWTGAGLPAELHVYERGGHGFAFRPHELPADRWTEAFEAWLAARGYIRAADR
jgi:acetyl esterase/lipase